MPPIYSPWLKAFEAIGRFGFFRRGGPMDGMSIGDPRQETDCDNDVTWRRLATSRDLFKAWSPPPTSPWSGYAKPTLFAAVDDFLYGLNPRPYRTTSIFATEQPAASGWQSATPGWTATEPIPPLSGAAQSSSASSASAPTFLSASGRPTMTPKVPSGYDPHSHPTFPRVGRSAIVIDLPGPQSVAMAAQLAHRAGFQPTVLFNNWPHSRGIVAMGDVLASLLYFSPWAEGAPARDDPASPPAFVLDRDRLGHHRPHPDDFDNRYYHPDADLPSANTLVKAGIERVLYLHPAPSSQASATETWIPTDRPPIPPGSDARFEAFLQELGPARETPEPTPDPFGPPEMDDLNPILVAWSKRLPVATVAVDGTNLQWAVPQAYTPRPRPTPFNTSKDPSFAGFRRSAAGGFGALVPVPGQGGIGGVGG